MIDPTQSSASLDRRAFVRRSTSTLIPAWIALAFGCSSGSPPPTRADEEPDRGHDEHAPAPVEAPALPEDPVEALRSLRSAVDAPPILAIVVPEGAPGLRSEAATLWAELIRKGAQGTILRLGACAMVCARAGEIAEALGVEVREPGAGDKQPMAVAMGADRKASREIRLERRQESGRMTRRGVFPGARQARFPQRKGAPQYESRWEALEGALNSALEEILPGELAGDAEATRQGLLENAPTGSRWAEDTGCGMRIDGVSKYPEISCGMGHVSPGSAHFLWFLSRG